MPTEDRGIGFGIVLAPEGATLDYTDRYMREIEDLLTTIPAQTVRCLPPSGCRFNGPGRVTNGILFMALKAA